MNYIINCLKELFGNEAKSPSGLCYFEHAEESCSYKPVRKESRKEIRLSELME